MPADASPSTLNTMKIKYSSAPLLTATLFLVLAVFVSQPSARASEAEQTITIVANDTLKFNVTRIEAKPGQKIHVQLRNEGTAPKETMGHNWILLDSDA